MAPKRRRNESGKKLVFSVSEWQKKFPPVRLPPSAFRTVFVCAYAALHDVSSYAMTYSHKPHLYAGPSVDASSSAMYEITAIDGRNVCTADTLWSLSVTVCKIDRSSLVS